VTLRVGSQPLVTLRVGSQPLVTLRVGSQPLVTLRVGSQPLVTCCAGVPLRSPSGRSGDRCKADLSATFQVASSPDTIDGDASGPPSFSGSPVHFASLHFPALKGGYPPCYPPAPPTVPSGTVYLRS